MCEPKLTAWSKLAFSQNRRANGRYMRNLVLSFNDLRIAYDQLIVGLGVATARSGNALMEVVTRVFAVNVALAPLAFATVWWRTSVISFGALVIGAALVSALLISFSRGRA